MLRHFRNSQSNGLSAVRAGRQVREHSLPFEIFQSVFDKSSKYVCGRVFGMNRLPRLEPLLQDVAHLIQTASATSMVKS